MIPWMREQIADVWHSRKTIKNGRTMPSATVNVVSLEGDVLSVPVTPDMTIDQLRVMAAKHFYGTDESPLNFHLVHAEKMKQLADDEEINPSDELLMVKIRPPVLRLEESAQLRIPTNEVILKATCHLPLPQLTKITPINDCPADFQAEIRKILVTLVQASSKILMHSPEAAKVYEIIKEKLELQSKPPNDPKTVKYLVDIGFSEKRVLKALQLRRMNVSEALEWLIEHQDIVDEELDEPPLVIPVVGPSSSTKRRSEHNLINIVGLALESAHQYKRLEFKPDSRIKQSLIEMGFDEQAVIETMRITGNNQSNACEWLLGARRKSLQNLDEGLNEDCPIYSAIMSNPHIQLSLTNPKMLLAYLSILETPSSTSIWINDPEVSPVLSQIFKTYHAEKHAIHMNRYNTL